MNTFIREMTVETTALTAIGNDFGQQAAAIARASDVLVGISASGRMADLCDKHRHVTLTETQKIQAGRVVLGDIFRALIDAAMLGGTEAARPT